MSLSDNKDKANFIRLSQLSVKVEYLFSTKKKILFVTQSTGSNTNLYVSISDLV